MVSFETRVIFGEFFDFVVSEKIYRVFGMTYLVESFSEVGDIIYIWVVFICICYAVKKCGNLPPPPPVAWVWNTSAPPGCSLINVVIS